MAKIVALTQLSPTMSEGTLAKWRKNEGDKVGPGDVLAEVETDKANMDLESFDKGVLLKRLITEGTAVKVGAPIAILGQPGEDISAVLAEAQKGGATTPPKAEAQAPAKSATPQPAPQPKEAPKVAAPAPKEAPRGAPKPSGDGDRILASPLARAIAREKGLDLGSVEGSGPAGRIVKRDVESLEAGARPRAAAGPEYEDVPLSPMRKTIARRLTESKQKIPHFYVTVECDAAPLKAFRAQANEGVDEKEKVSLNDAIVKCVAHALQKTPAANASFMEDGGAPFVRKWKGVHVGIAVSLEDGLITPVVRDADRKTLTEIARETKDLIARARVKKLKPEEYTGSTISVSNMGMYDVDEFNAVINPPESTILAVGSIQAKPVVVNGKLEIGERMRLTLSCDHRVVDGALGAQLVGKIKAAIEHPIKAVI
jgi:pyruvate dehydrogenase E2 component (dihydrolipoamide acetyltransferase)